MTVEYATASHMVQTESISRSGAVATVTWLYVLAFVNLATAVTVWVRDCPAWVLFTIFMVDLATVAFQGIRKRP